MIFIVNITGHKLQRVFKKKLNFVENMSNLNSGEPQVMEAEPNPETNAAATNQEEASGSVSAERPNSTQTRRYTIGAGFRFTFASTLNNDLARVIRNSGATIGLALSSERFRREINPGVRCQISGQLTLPSSVLSVLEPLMQDGSEAATTLFAIQNVLDPGSEEALVRMVSHRQEQDEGGESVVRIQLSGEITIRMVVRNDDVGSTGSTANRETVAVPIVFALEGYSDHEEEDDSEDDYETDHSSSSDDAPECFSQSAFKPPYSVDDGNCPVCLGSYTGNEPMITVCGHIFCNPCITEVLKSSRQCPVCRQRIKEMFMRPYNSCFYKLSK